MIDLDDIVVAPLEDAIDWRGKEWRREAFQDFYEFHTSLGIHPGLVYLLIPYLRDYYEWTDEETLWFAILNANTQNPVTSLLLHNHGTNPSEVDSLVRFYRANYERLAWDTDRRYHRPHLGTSLRGYIQMLDGRTQREFWDEMVAGGWKNIWQVVSVIPTFGRLSSWSYCDYLHICGVEVNCQDLFLDDMDGSRSHRNGICLVTGLDVYEWHQSNPEFNGYYPSRLVKHLDKLAAELLVEAQTRATGKPWARDVNYLTLESILCTYKSWHRRNRRYPGVYCDMLYERIRQVEQNFPLFDTHPFWQARQDKLPPYLRLEDRRTDPGLTPLKQNWYLTCGEIPVMGHAYPKYYSGFDAAVDAGEWGTFR
jgi:hypothetical protein